MLSMGDILTLWENSAIDSQETINIYYQKLQDKKCIKSQAFMLKIDM